MPVYDITYKTLGHTHPGISTAAKMGEYTPPKKGMELGSNALGNLSSIHPNIYIYIYTIDKTGHGHKGLTQCHIH